jgi:hypothetical protein
LRYKQYIDQQPVTFQRKKGRNFRNKNSEFFLKLLLLKMFKTFVWNLLVIDRISIDKNIKKIGKIYLYYFRIAIESDHLILLFMQIPLCANSITPTVHTWEYRYTLKKFCFIKKNLSLKKIITNTVLDFPFYLQCTGFGVQYSVIW